MHRPEMVDHDDCWWPLQTLTSAWETEREEMKKLQAIKAEIDRVNLEVQNAEREYDLNRAAELKYGVLVSLQKQLKAAEEALTTQVCRARSLTGSQSRSISILCCRPSSST